MGVISLGYSQYQDLAELLENYMEFSLKDKELRNKKRLDYDIHYDD